MKSTGSELIQVNVTIKEKKTLATLDSGAQCNLIRRKNLKRLLGEEIKLKPAENTLIDVQSKIIECFGVVQVELKIGSQTFSTHLHVVEQLPSDILLGLPFMKVSQMVVYMGKDMVSIKGERVKMIFSGSSESMICQVFKEKEILPFQSKILKVKRTNNPYKKHELYKVVPLVKDLYFEPIVSCPGKAFKLRVNNLTEKPISVNKLEEVVKLEPFNQHELEEKEREGILPERPTLSPNEIEELIQKIEIGKCSEKTRENLLKMLREVYQVFSRDNFDIGELNLDGFEHKLELLPDAKPKAFKPYPLSKFEEELLDRYLKRMLDLGLIRRSNSPWALPVILVKKGENDRRVVINMKYLNQNIKKVATFLPRIESLLGRFGHKKNFMSKLDLTQFFWQIKLSKDTQELCSFSTHRGAFSSNRVIQGEANAPNCSQQAITRVLEGIENAFYIIDDIACVDSSEEQHLKTLKEIFLRIRKHGLTIRPDKVKLFMEKMEFLGHEVTRDGEMTVPLGKRDKAFVWSRPQSVKEVRGFLGFTNFLRKFIRGYSEIAKPIVELTKLDKLKESDWTKECEMSFQKLKDAIQSAPCIQVPSSDGEMHLFTDASINGLGYLLAEEKQVKGGKKFLQVCLYGSRLFRGAEAGYSIPEKELLAASWSIRKNRPYLYGKRFTLHCDSQPVCHILRSQGNKELSSRMLRFMVDILDYDFKVCHVRSEQNYADALSRLPVVVDNESGELCYRMDDSEVIGHHEGEVADSIVKDPILVGPITRGRVLDNSLYPGLLNAQQMDPEVIRIKQEIRRRGEGQISKYGLIFWIHRDYLVSRKPNIPGQMKYFVPLALREEIIDVEHGAIGSGHLGNDKTYSNIEKRFFWPGMRGEIEDFVKTCDTCQRAKHNFLHKRSPLGSLPRPERPQQVLALDVKGPLARSNRGKKYVIVVVDLFSKYAFTKCVASVTGIVVADFLVEEVFRFGCPDAILCDNAPNLKAGVAGGLYRRLGIQNLNSSPYFPSGNGAVERLIGTLSSMIRCASMENQRDWSNIVPLLTSKYNETVHRSTKMSPFYVHFGYHPRSMTFTEVQQNIPHYSNQDQYASEIAERRDIVNSIVRRGMIRYYQDSKDDFNKQKNVRSHNFYKGQWVLVKILGPKKDQSKGLGPLYQGPAEILWVNQHTAKIVYLLNNVQSVRNVSHLKPYFPRKGDPNLNRTFTAPSRGEVANADADGSSYQPIQPIASTSRQADEREREENAQVEEEDESDDEEENSKGKKVHFNL